MKSFVVLLAGLVAFCFVSLAAADQYIPITVVGTIAKEPVVSIDGKSEVIVFSIQGKSGKIYVCKTDKENPMNVSKGYLLGILLQGVAITVHGRFDDQGECVILDSIDSNGQKFPRPIPKQK